MCAACCYLLLISALPVGQSATLNFTKLEASANQEMAATKTPGAAIGVVRDGRLVYVKGFGTSNIETGASITPETLFRLGSTTKMLTAPAVATLVAEGKLDFQEPVGKYIHGFDPAIAETLFVIGDETESSSRDFTRRHSVVLSATIKHIRTSYWI